MKPSQHLVFTVTNDLSYDQRMDRICGTLAESGFTVTLIGRLRKTSIPLSERGYHTRRIRCVFEKGKLFYLEYNLRLFLRLMLIKADVFGAVDLDTAMAVYVAARLRSKQWTFDAHEYFSELEEVISRPFVHHIWQWVEAFIMKRVKHAYTISEGYATLFKKRYHTDFDVIRNVPLTTDVISEHVSGIPYIIYQGALNIGRGIEESISAMQFIDGLELHIYGEGPIENQLKKQVIEEGLEQKVLFLGSLPPHELKPKTKGAFAGLTLFSPQGLHHQHSLANRFFDYFHAGIPQVVVGYSEYRSFNARYSIAVEIDKPEAKRIAEALNRLKADRALYNEMKSNCKKAIEENNWKLESQKLLKIYERL